MSCANSVATGAADPANLATRETRVSGTTTRILFVEELEEPRTLTQWLVALYVAWRDAEIWQGFPTACAEMRDYRELQDRVNQARLNEGRR